MVVADTQEANMADHCDHCRKIREEMERAPVEQHEHLYVMFYSALLTNEEGGYKEQADFTRGQIESLLRYGKISDQRAAQIRIDTRAKRKQILELIQETVWTDILGTPISLTDP